MAMTRTVLLCLLAVSLAACSPLSKEIRREAASSPPFAEIQKDPDKYRGTVVIWGGLIIDTANRETSVVLKVMQTALDFEQRPTDLDRSEGRFIVIVDRFLDPVIFKKGREITVGGEITGKEIHPIGGVQYVYPVVRARELKLWPQRIVYPPYYYDPWYWGPPYDPWRPWGPWGRPYWW
jgi:outer membrane lipoprotein